MGEFLQAIRLPLADLLRAAADWLDSEPVELEQADPQQAPKWLPDGRGGFKPTEE